MRISGVVAVVWGTVGVMGLLCSAIYRLTPVALRAYDGTHSAGWWAGALGFCAFMAYAEGYRGFQLGFSPRTAERVRRLGERPDLASMVLAPLVAIGYVRSERRLKIRVYSLTLGILALVMLVRLLEQPWRGVIDSGVVVGLAWGVLSLAWCIVQALRQPATDGCLADTGLITGPATDPVVGRLPGRKNQPPS